VSLVKIGSSILVFLKIIIVETIKVATAMSLNERTVGDYFSINWLKKQSSTRFYPVQFHTDKANSAK
jgi:hypothetical protein